jgi:hypothetical protein
MVILDREGAATITGADNPRPRPSRDHLKGAASAVRTDHRSCLERGVALMEISAASTTRKAGGFGWTAWCAEIRVWNERVIEA